MQSPSSRRSSDGADEECSLLTAAAAQSAERFVAAEHLLRKVWIWQARCALMAALLVVSLLAQWRGWLLMPPSPAFVAPAFVAPAATASNRSLSEPSKADSSTGWQSHVRYLCEFLDESWRRAPSSCAVYRLPDSAAEAAELAAVAAGQVLTDPPPQLDHSALLFQFPDKYTRAGALFDVTHTVHGDERGGRLRVVHANCPWRSETWATRLVRTEVDASNNVSEPLDGGAAQRDSIERLFGPDLFEARLVGPEYIHLMLPRNASAPHPCTYEWDYTGAVSIDGTYHVWLHWIQTDFAWLRVDMEKLYRPQWAVLVQAVPVRLRAALHAHSRALQPVPTRGQLLERARAEQLQAGLNRLPAPAPYGRYVHREHAWAKYKLAWFDVPDAPKVRPQYGCWLVEPNDYVWVPYASTAQISGALSADQQHSLLQQARAVALADHPDSPGPLLHWHPSARPLTWAHVDACFGNETRLFLGGDSQTRLLAGVAVQQFLELWDRAIQKRVFGEPHLSTDADTARINWAEDGDCNQVDAVQLHQTRGPVTRQVCFFEQNRPGFYVLLPTLLQSDFSVVSYGHFQARDLPPQTFHAHAAALRHELEYLRRTPIQSEHIERLNAQHQRWHAHQVSEAARNGSVLSPPPSSAPSPGSAYVPGDTWLRVAQRKLIWWTTQVMPFTYDDIRRSVRDGRTVPRLSLYSDVMRAVLLEYNITALSAEHIGLPFHDCAEDSAHLDARFRHTFFAAVLHTAVRKRGCTFNDGA